MNYQDWIGDIRYHSVTNGGPLGVLEFVIVTFYQLYSILFYRSSFFLFHFAACSKMCVHKKRKKSCNFFCYTHPSIFSSRPSVRKCNSLKKRKNKFFWVTHWLHSCTSQQRIFLVLIYFMSYNLMWASKFKGGEAAG